MSARAKKTDKTENKSSDAAETAKTETVVAPDTPAEEKPSRSRRKKASSAEFSEEFLASLRDQIENCTEELKASLENSIRREYLQIAEKQIAKAHRRRRWNNFFHDLVIVVLAFATGYLGYRVWQTEKTAKETNGEQAALCNEVQPSETAGPVKDAAWYLANYSYLYDRVKSRLDADRISAYYPYNGDHKVEEMPVEYRLSIAANQLGLNELNRDPESRISVSSLEKAYADTFGSSTGFEKVGFSYRCWDFSYDKTSEDFIASSSGCGQNTSKREIVESIEKIYEEGEAIYMVTVAGVREKATGDLYRFDDLFQPVVLNAGTSDLTAHAASLNRYQYQFKEGENGAWFYSGVIKLR